jgi:hypothetical protein
VYDAGSDRPHASVSNRIFAEHVKILVIAIHPINKGIHLFKEVVDPLKKDFFVINAAPQKFHIASDQNRVLTVGVMEHFIFHRTQTPQQLIAAMRITCYADHDRLGRLDKFLFFIRLPLKENFSGKNFPNPCLRIGNNGVHLRLSANGDYRKRGVTCVDFQENRKQ